MKKVARAALSIFVLAILFIPNVFAQDSTAVAAASPAIPSWGVPAAGIVVGLYELIVRYIPTVKNYSIIGFIIKVIQTVVPNKNAVIPSQPHP